MNRLLTIVDTKYQRLEYLESSGTQYIDTGVSAPNGFVAEINCMKTGGTTQATLIWSEISVSPWECNGVRIFGNNNTIPYALNLGLVSAYTSSAPVVINQKHKIEVSTVKSDAYVKLDGVDVITRTTTGDLSSNSLYLGANNSGGTAKDFFTGRFYPVKIWDYQGNLIRFYIPVLRKSDNELGMLDLVEGKFYGNAGTGKFTANLDTMYAIIQGSPTQSPYGVFSGFSGTNYLELQNDIDTTKDYEIVVKFVNSTSKYHSVILGSNSTANSIKIEVSYGTRFFIFLSSNGTSWNIANGAYGLTNAMSLGNTYYMKLTYSTTSGYKLYLSIDRVNWSLQWSIGTTNALYMTNAKFVLGASLFDNNSLGGGIDLNRSYVKSQSTKYKLQAVVGYEVVGSPTISDGVVSGFSDSNYLTIPCFDREVALQKGFEATIEFTTSSTISNGQIFGLFFSGSYDGFRIGSGKSISYWFFGSDYVISSSANFLQENKTYIMRVIFKDNVLSLYCGEKGSLNLIGSLNYTSSTLGTQKVITFGISTSFSASFNGSINLNNSYIKVNNKLYFNGQQA